MNGKQIIEHYLRANGFDGLATDGCGCGLDDFMPCGGCLDCKPAKKHKCDGTCSGCDVMTYGICYRVAEPQQNEEETHL